MNRPERGAGFKTGGLIYDHLSGWVDHDAKVVNSLIAVFTDPDREERDVETSCLLMWAHCGQHEPRR